MSVKVVKRVLESGEEVHIFHNHVPEKELQIYILFIESKKAFFGALSKIQLRSMAAELKIPFDNFLSETLQFLGSLEPNELHIYQLLNSNEVYTFKWKKQVPDKGFKINYGEAKVEPRNFDSLLTQVLNETSHKFQTAIEERDQQIAELKLKENTLVETEKLLQQALTAKENLEKELYTKFVLVLNNKKQKIGELHKKVKTLEDMQKKKDKKSSSVPAADISVSGPSSSGRNNDASLIFDDEDMPSRPLPKQAQTRMRNRIRAQAQPATRVTRCRKERSRSPDMEEEVDDLLNDL